MTLTYEQVVAGQEAVEQLEILQLATSLMNCNAETWEYVLGVLHDYVTEYHAEEEDNTEAFICVSALSRLHTMLIVEEKK